MKKILVLNLEKIEIEGDILDVACDNLGFIYNLSKEGKDEVAIDYIESEDRENLKEKNYDAATFFFNLNFIWTLSKKEKLIDEISTYLKAGGEIYIWDINKNVGELVDTKLKVILKGGEIKDYRVKNNNLFSSSSFDETKKVLEKNFKIEETKVWEDIYFIKGIKI